MKKIPTLLVRDPDDRSKVLDEVNPGCEWVLAGAFYCYPSEHVNFVVSS